MFGKYQTTATAAKPRQKSSLRTRVSSRLRTRRIITTALAAALSLTWVAFPATSYADPNQAAELCNPGGTVCLSWSDPSGGNGDQITVKAPASNNSENLGLVQVSGTYQGNPEYEIQWNAQSLCAGVENNLTVDTDNCGATGTKWALAGNAISGYKFINVAASQQHGNANYYLTGVAHAPVTVATTTIGEIQTWNFCTNGTC